MPAVAAEGTDQMTEQLPDAHRLEIESTPASAIVMKRVRWLWQGWVPLGELTIAAGREGAAKSQFTVWEAAAITRGWLAGDLYGQPRNVIICAREDDWEKTIAPRLWAAGADMTRVFRTRVRDVVSGRSMHLSLPLDNDLLRKEIDHRGAALVVFDPLLSVLSPSLNTHRAGDVRMAIEPLSEIAHDTGCCITGVAHFAKTEGRDAASLISGSHAFKDVARAILVFAKDDEDTGIMSQVKNSLGRIPSQSLAYSVGSVQLQVSDGWADVPKFVLGDPTRRHVGDLLDQGRAREVAKARDFLRGTLMLSWRLSKEVEEEARMDGISSRTLDRARQDLGVKATKNPEDGKWWLHF
jgi:AAA domain